MDQSEGGSDPALSAAAKGTPGSTSSWKAGPHCPHNTPPLLYPGGSGHLRHTPAPMDDLACQPELKSAGKASSNAVTPDLVNTDSNPSDQQESEPPQDPPSNPSTEGNHSVIATVVGPSEFEPSDSIKRQLLAAAGGTLDAASLEGLVRPLFASPPAAEQQDLQSLLLAAQQQHQQNQQARSEQPAALQSRRSSLDPAGCSATAAGHAEHYLSGLKAHTNPIAKPQAVPCNVKAAAVDSTSQQPPTAQSKPLPDQSELYKAAAAHMAVMLQIPFSGSLGPWQPPPLDLDSPPLSVLDLNQIPASKGSLSALPAVTNLPQQLPTHVLPAGTQSTLSMLTNPAAMQRILQHTCPSDGTFDLEALMKNVKVEGADLYAAAKAVKLHHSGEQVPCLRLHMAVVLASVCLTLLYVCP